MIGDTSFQPYAINTFSRKGRKMTTITPVHYVKPHAVSSYRRKDGTFVSGYWRDGDGNTAINRSKGYYSKNPNAKTYVMSGKGRR